MNQTSRTDEPYEGDDGLNQSPNAFSNDLITNQDFNGIANARTQRPGNGGRTMDSSGQAITNTDPPNAPLQPDRVAAGAPTPARPAGTARRSSDDNDDDRVAIHAAAAAPDAPGQAPGSVRGRTAQVFRDYLQRKMSSGGDGSGHPSPVLAAPAATTTTAKAGGSPIARAMRVLVTFGKFVGPGFMVSVAYIDPGNYSTDIAAGASYQFRLLFVVLMSNLFAILLQSLSVKLGTVTGLNLAEANRAFLPRWLNYFLYAMAEIAIIATDIAEVIGTAIALNLLIPALPLVAGCALSILDVMLLLVFYHPQGSMRALRSFEFFVMLLVLAVVVCFCIELSHIEDTTVGQVFKGYLPNNAVVQGEGLYQACGILGATVMPHSLYLGSGLPQRRLLDYDEQHDLLPADAPTSSDGSISEGKSGDKVFYAPSVRAIRHCLKYSYAELAISLFTFALFVNSAILIVAGASLYGNVDALDADIFGIHSLLRENLGSGAATVFALALLFSGVSAGVVCTISGQMVCEGAMRWRVRPWLRRLLTRSLSITPSIIIAGATGRDKLSDALNGSQVALSIVLPFVSAPLIYYTCLDRFMTVRGSSTSGARFYREGDEKCRGGGDGDDAADAADAAGRGCVLAATTTTATTGSTRRVSGGGGSRPKNILRGRVLSDEHEAEGDQGRAERGRRPAGDVQRMANDWWVCVLSVLVWLIITIMNVANLVLLGLGN